MSENQIAHLIKFLPEQNKYGRPMSDAQSILQGIFYLLKTGCQWNALPKCFGASSTIHDNFQKFIKCDLFLKAWTHALEKYDLHEGLALSGQSFDCAHIKAPLGGDLTGKSPVDRAKIGTKRAMLTDKKGIPLALKIFGGNAHDSKTIIETVQCKLYHRFSPFQTVELDAAFDDENIRTFFAYLNYNLRISPNKRRKGFVQRVYHQFRWSVERTHSWINRFRRLLVR
jgi:transposase